MNFGPEWIRKFGIAMLALIFAALLSAGVSRAQDQEKKPEEQKGPKAASVEVTPKTGNAQLGDQLQFKAVAKDAAGNVLGMKPTVWFAAPFDAATADVNGLVHFTSPGEITVGAVFGEQVGFAKVMVASDPVARLEIMAPKGALAVGGAIALPITAYTADGIPRPDAHYSWKVAHAKDRQRG